MNMPGVERVSVNGINMHLHANGDIVSHSLKTSNTWEAHVIKQMEWALQQQQVRRTNLHQRVVCQLAQLLDTGRITGCSSMISTQGWWLAAMLHGHNSPVTSSYPFCYPFAQDPCHI
jgi:hypothetical protein